MYNNKNLTLKKILNFSAVSLISILGLNLTTFASNKDNDNQLINSISDDEVNNEEQNRVNDEVNNDEFNNIINEILNDHEPAPVARAPQIGVLAKDIYNLGYKINTDETVQYPFLVDFHNCMTSFGKDFFNGFLKEELCFPDNRSSIKEIWIPSTVTKIDEDAFGDFMGKVLFSPFGSPIDFGTNSFKSLSEDTIVYIPTGSTYNENLIEDILVDKKFVDDRYFTGHLPEVFGEATVIVDPYRLHRRYKELREAIEKLKTLENNDIAIELIKKLEDEVNQLEMIN